jgi:LCP family protein required for cell wall assembly
VSATSPIRNPDLRSQVTMTKRAWWLVILNIVIPGSVQLLAGNRKLGRFGVAATFTLWALASVAAIVFFTVPTVLYTLATNVWALAVAELVLAAYAALWVILTLDTLRLVKLIRTGPVARPFIGALTALALLATAGGALYTVHLADVTRSTIQSVFDSGQYAAPVDGRYNILLLGGDAGADRMGLRPDSISVASVDASTGATTIIGIPRNMEYIRFADDSPLWKEFPNGYDCGDQCLISYLYTYGIDNPELYPDAEANGSNAGIEAMRDAASGVLGLELQYYVLIDMQGFANLVDALGGVDVEVPTRTAIGPITSSKPIGFIEAGPQHLDGANALWYARSRFDSNDFERMARQRQVQEAMLKQFEPANVLSKFQAVAEAGAQVVRTDIPGVMLGIFVDLADKSRALPLAQLDLVPPDFDTSNPDYDRIHQAVRDSLVRPQ